MCLCVWCQQGADPDTHSPDSDYLVTEQRRLIQVRKHKYNCLFLLISRNTRIHSAVEVVKKIKQVWQEWSEGLTREEEVVNTH